MSQKINSVIVSLVLLVGIGCSEKQDSTLTRSELTQSQWVSNKLFEEPDLRDTFIFHDDSTFTFFDAASVTDFTGSYKLKGDTVIVVYNDQELKPAEQYKLLYQEGELVNIYSDFGEKVIEKTSGKLRYKRAPSDRALY